MKPERRLFTILGPGLLMAAASIGVSHLVQATRAGALHGMDLLLFILLAFVLPIALVAACLCVFSGACLMVGQYRWLDGIIKVLLIILLISTLAGNGIVRSPDRMAADRRPHP